MCFFSNLGFWHGEISQNYVGEAISGTSILKIINKKVTKNLQQKEKKRQKNIAFVISPPEEIINCVEYEILSESGHNL